MKHVEIINLDDKSDSENKEDQSGQKPEPIADSSKSTFKKAIVNKSLFSTDEDASKPQVSSQSKAKLNLRQAQPQIKPKSTVLLSSSAELS